MREKITLRSSRVQSTAMRCLLRALLLSLCLAQPLAARAQTNGSAPLPPAAQEALDKGVAAAKVPDYLLAIRYFEEARKAAPQAPIVFLNLGIAESKIPGRELRAIAWLGAYLAAYPDAPDAPNAAAVREQIAVLEVRNQSNVARLLKIVQEAFPKSRPHPLGPGLPALPVDSSPYLSHVAQLWARTGDATMAVKTADLIQNAKWKSDARRAVATVLADSGYIAGAQKAADGAEGQDKEMALRAVARAKAQAGIVDTVSVHDWLSMLDDNNVSRCPSTTGPFRDFSNNLVACPLSAGPFLDLAAYLTSLPPSDDPEKAYQALYNTANMIINARARIAAMLRRAANR